MTWRPDRRRFLQTAAVLSAPLVLPARVFGANERIVLGVIGVGTQGSTLLSSFAKRATVAAIADVSLPRAEEKAKSCGADTAVQDYRRLLERKDIDAVVIAVPHHWHALCAIHAAQAGKDIYCEKPLAYTIEEGRRITEAVRKHGRVFQTGLQQRSGAKEYEGCMHVRNGTLGAISKVLAYDYASGSIVRQSAGSYTFDINPLPSGTPGVWRYSYVGSGALNAMFQGAFAVRQEPW